MFNLIHSFMDNYITVHNHKNDSKKKKKKTKTKEQKSKKAKKILLPNCFTPNKQTNKHQITKQKKNKKEKAKQQKPRQHFPFLIHICCLFLFLLINQLINYSSSCLTSLSIFPCNTASPICFN